MLQNCYQYLILFFLLAYVPVLSSAEPLYIIYTANINGALENCGCGDKPLGGIGKIKRIADTYRKDHSKVLLIDGGDFFNNYPYKALNEAMLRVYHSMKYDFSVPGDQIFIDGEYLYQKASLSMNGRMVISNTAPQQKNPLVAKYGLYSVSFMSILSPAAFDYISKPENIKLIDPENVKLTALKDGTLKIVVYHGYLDDAKQFAAKNKNINILFLAHDETSGVWWEDNVCIVGNGKDSESISIIKANFDNSWELEVEQKQISDEYPEAEDILDIIDEFKENPDQE